MSYPAFTCVRTNVNKLLLQYHVAGHTHMVSGDSLSNSKTYQVADDVTERVIRDYDSLYTGLPEPPDNVRLCDSYLIIAAGPRPFYVLQS